jgi:hypothetical protein
MSDRTCEGCVHREVCVWLFDREVGGMCDCGMEHWRGDDSAVVEAARVLEVAFDEGMKPPMKVERYPQFWHRLKLLFAALDALEVDRG